MVEMFKIGNDRFLYHYDFQKYIHSSCWLGSLVDTFGMKDQEVEVEDFYHLTNGLYPDGSTKLLDRNNNLNSAAGIEMVVLKPKSLSIAYICALVWDSKRAEDLMEIDRVALRNLIRFIEQLHASVKIRVVKKGPRTFIKTGKLLMANFCHLFSAGVQEAHWHWHCTVMPISLHNESLYSLQNNLIVRSAKLYGALYRAELIYRLHLYGIETRFTDARNDFFELKVFSDDLKNIFSSRKKQIEEYREEFRLIYPNASTKALSYLAKFKNREKSSEKDVGELIKKNVNKIRKAGFTESDFFRMFGNSIMMEPLNIEAIVYAIYQKIGDALFTNSFEWLIREIAIEAIQSGRGATIDEMTNAFIETDYQQVCRKIIDNQRIEHESKRNDLRSVAESIESLYTNQKALLVNETAEETDLDEINKMKP